MSNSPRPTSPEPTLAEAPQNIESWWRTQSATMALLKHVQVRLEEAERTIGEQTQKIHALQELAGTDPLTGLLNRRGITDAFEREMARLQRGHSQGAILVLIDLDHFKNINDTHGHMAGDACLIAVAEQLLDCTRATDSVARLGGDEFVMLFAQTDMSKAGARLDKISKALDAIELEWQGEKLRFGASFGHAQLSKDSSFAKAYETADSALYADKKRRHKKSSY